ncbi:MAG: hypothetical protein L7V30_00110, partial [Gammaproteobacteria bacterium]|nr:hypothetical protein [Gammaproteobacteria bacterium]
IIRMNSNEQQLPKTNAEWTSYYEAILQELTDNQKKVGQPIAVNEFYELPIKRKQKYIKKLYVAIGDAE